MEVKQHGEHYQVTLEADETVSITVGSITKEWTVQAGNVGTFNVKFSEEKVTV